MTAEEREKRAEWCDLIRKRVKELKAQFEPFAEKGWMCEGADDADGNLYNVIFNNETNESLTADYSGKIISSSLNVTTLKDARKMADIQGNIRKTLEAL